MQRLPHISTALIAIVLSSAMAAQTPAPLPEDSGTVSGHVYCEDTNGPARMARVMLEPVTDVSSAVKHANRSHHQSMGPGAQMVLPTMNSVQTGLDGSFTMEHVKPGAYYVIAEMPGYLSSIADLSEDEWRSPTASVADRMAKALPKVMVEAGRTANANIGLERGAAVSGTISFDDGSPASGVHIKVLRGKSDGSWDTVRLSAIHPFMDSITTNDLGQYRIAGLIAGHYVIEADLSLSEIKITGFMGQTRDMAETPQYSLSIFTGGYLRARADAAFALTKGEDRTGEDIAIPLSKLHSVSGTVVASEDGHALGGDVELLYGDDKKVLATADLDRTSGGYRLFFVPEGHFVLEVQAWDPQTLIDGEAGRPSKIMHAYVQLEQPLDVHGDIDGLVLSVPYATAAGAITQSSNPPH